MYKRQGEEGGEDKKYKSTSCLRGAAEDSTLCLATAVAARPTLRAAAVDGAAHVEKLRQPRRQPVGADHRDSKRVPLDRIHAYVVRDKTNIQAPCTTTNNSHAMCTHGEGCCKLNIQLLHDATDKPDS